jgi:hypothetical protein
LVQEHISSEWLLLLKSKQLKSSATVKTNEKSCSIPPKEEKFLLQIVIEQFSLTRKKNDC